MCRPYGGDVASPGGASGRPRPTKGAAGGSGTRSYGGVWIKNGGRTMCSPYRRGGGNLAPHPPQCAHWGTCPYPLCPFGTSPLDKGSRPPGGRLRKNKKGQVFDLSLKTQRRNEVSQKISLLTFFFKERSPGSEEPGLLAYCFSSGPLVSQPRGFLMAAWAAASRAMGTRKGEQDT